MKSEFKPAKKCKNKVDRIMFSMTMTEAMNIAFDLRKIENHHYDSWKFISQYTEKHDLFLTKLIAQNKS